MGRECIPFKEDYSFLMEKSKQNKKPSLNFCLGLVLVLDPVLVRTATQV